MALCVDFEDMPTPKDGVAPAATIVASNVVPQDRLLEYAAELAPISELKISDTSKLDITRNLTIEMWTKPTLVPSDSGDQQVGLFDVHLQYQLNFESDRSIECRIFEDDESDNVDSLAQLAIGQWHHVACTYDGATLRVYVDGRLQGCQSTSRTISIDGTSGAAIGANMDNGPEYKNHFVGQLDNVHVYASTLTAGDICQLWGGGSCSDRCPSTINGPSGPSGGGGGGGFGGFGG